MSSSLIGKMSKMIYCGMVAGFALELFIPKQDTSNGNLFSQKRKYIIFAGMCLYSWMVFRREDSVIL